MIRDFADLYDRLDRTRSTNAKVAAMVEWFGAVEPVEAAWAVRFLIGRRPKRLLSARQLATWTCELADVPGWLFDACYASVGDLAEVVTLLLPDPDEETDAEVSLADWITRLETLRGKTPEDQRDSVVGWWRALGTRERFVLNKIITGEFRVGVSQTLVERALSELTELPRPVIAHRLMGRWTASEAFWEGLCAPEGEGDDDVSRPYPFFLAHPLQAEPSSLGDRGDWQVEWKWDGIRCQLIRREGQTFLWSRGEELLTERFPEIAVEDLPDGTVLDGEILAWDAEAELPRPFADLQTRIHRKRVTKAVLAKVPTVFMAYDLLELDGVDVRSEPQSWRRERLQTLTLPAPLRRSAVVEASTWPELVALQKTARERQVEGFMIKKRAASYGTGRTKGIWWKWKIEPLEVDAVLIYAHPGQGRRANRFTDFTFGLWRGPALVPICRAYSGLTDAEVEELDKWVRRNTQQRFGPVRQVDPIHVFQLQFEGVRRSTRHKSGLSLRFPRIARWRRDKHPLHADQLATLEAMLPEEA